MNNPCALSKHVATIEQTRFDLTRVQLGCVPKVLDTPVEMAPADLREMQLPAGWTTMRSFSLTKGNTEYIPDLPESLEHLAIGKNRILELPPLPNSLRDIYLSENEINVLPNIPTSCRLLEIKRNRLERLPALPTTLEKIHVTRNFLRELPSFETTKVKNVGCGFNRLTSLPKFPASLRVLGCSENQITSISNLPDGLQVLNCAHNPLVTLNIDNLRSLRILIADGCSLKRIPVLPIPKDDDDNNENDNDNANNNGVPNIIIHNNPLEPNFAQILDDYHRDGNYTRLRTRVLEEHRRIIAKEKETLGAMIQVFKPATLKEVVPTDEAERYAAEVRQRVFANHGPANLIASFITGKPGTVEMQRLALVENQERLGAVPKGTSETMRKKIADIAVNEKQSDLMRARAKLYVKMSNREEAKKRYEKKLAELAFQKKLSERLSEILKGFFEFETLLDKEIDKVTGELNDIYDTELEEKKHKHLYPKARLLENDMAKFANILFSIGRCDEIFDKIMKITLKNKLLRKLAGMNLKLELLCCLKKDLGAIHSKFLKATDEDDLEFLITEYLSILEFPSKTLSEYVEILRSITEKAFPDSRTEEEIESVSKSFKELCSEIADKINIFRKGLEGWASPNNLAGYYGNNSENGENGKNNENGENKKKIPKEEKEALNELARIHNDYAQVVNDDEEDGEAMRYALAEAAEEEEMARLQALRNEELEYENRNRNNEDDEEEKVEENENEYGPQYNQPLENNALEAQAQRMARELVELGLLNEGEAIRVARGREVAQRFAERQGGSKHRTAKRGKGKGKQQTRKQKK